MVGNSACRPTVDQESSLSLGRYVKKAMCFGQKLLISSAC
jgi:hypothetical protein